MVPEGCDDPCKSIPMNPKRELFLTNAECTRLGQVLNEVSGNGSQISVGAVTTIHLLMRTGCGKTVIMTPRWAHVDLDWAEIRIVDGKTGTRMVHLSPATVGLLATLPRKPDNPCVVPGAKPGHAHDRHRQHLAVDPHARRTARRAHSRHSAPVRLARSGPW